MSEHWDELQNNLEQIREKNLFRECLQRDEIDFCSNDYLGLANSPELIQLFSRNVLQSSTGSTASRLVRGHRKSMSDFEAKFANFVHSENSLLVANGYVANMGLIDTIADSQTYIFTDRLNHASILDGIRISGAQKKYYNHLDLDHLESQLIKLEANSSQTNKKRIIVSETLFSMDGDSPDLKKLIEIKRKNKCVLILDEAHALGVFGKNGRGLCFETLTEEDVDEIDYRVYTLGKALGLEGGIIATSNIGRDYLVNRMRAFIFSTAPIPAISLTAIGALDMLAAADDKRSHLHKIAKLFKDRLIAEGFQISPTTSHIVPVLMPSEREALSFSEALKKRGFDIRAIRPPTVPNSRLRISLNAEMSISMIESLVLALVATRQEISGQKDE